MHVNANNTSIVFLIILHGIGVVFIYNFLYVNPIDQNTWCIEFFPSHVTIVL